MSKKDSQSTNEPNLSPLNFPNISDKKSFLRFEKIPVSIYTTSDAASIAIANEVASIIKIKQLRREKCLIGLATGSTMSAFYEELVRLHKNENLSFNNVMTFNVDEF